VPGFLRAFSSWSIGIDFCGIAFVGFFGMIDVLMRGSTGGADDEGGSGGGGGGGGGGGEDAGSSLLGAGVLGGVSSLCVTVEDAQSISARAKVDEIPGWAESFVDGGDEAEPS
jgi:hypothetical protein